MFGIGSMEMIVILVILGIIGTVLWRLFSRH
jgi:hypothetical protein